MLAKLGMTADVARRRDPLDDGDRGRRHHAAPARRSTSTSTPPAPTASCPSTGSSRTPRSTGPIESGCTKMAVVGFGKQPGAAQFHACGAGRDARPAARRHRRAARDRPAARRRGVGRGAVRRRRHRPRPARRRGRRRRRGGPHRAGPSARAALPFAEIDVLVIEQGGKDISGTTLDPTSPGASGSPGSPTSTGAAGGDDRAARPDRGDGRQRARASGSSTSSPPPLAERSTGRRPTSTAFTAGGSGVRRARLPMVLPDEESCIRAALATCGRPVRRPKRVVRIRSTLHLTRCWVSDALLADLPPTAASAVPS